MTNVLTTNRYRSAGLLSSNMRWCPRLSKDELVETTAFLLSNSTRLIQFMPAIPIIAVTPRLPQHATTLFSEEECQCSHQIHTLVGICLIRKLLAVRIIWPLRSGVQVLETRFVRGKQMSRAKATEIVCCSMNLMSWRNVYSPDSQDCERFA